MEARWPWVHVGRSTRQAGWKIHLSCTPLGLARLAGHLARTWRRRPFAFKLIASIDLAMLLDEGAFGDSQIGKCATVYPRDDHEFASLVAIFCRIDDVTGPVVPDDVRLGEIVHARHGGFNPVIRRDTLGQMERLVADGDGTLRPDHYDRALTLERFDTSFAGTPLGARLRPVERIPRGVLDGRYLIVDVLRDAGKGALLQALDTRAQGAVRAMILKQGRAHVLADRNGRDIRDRLRHQERLHTLAAAHGIAPACDPCLAVGDDLFLPIVFQHNDNLEARVQTLLAGRTIDHCSAGHRRAILGTLEQVAALLGRLHGLGVVHRDLSPSNIVLDREGRPLLSDLEIAWRIGSDEPVYGKGTPGFMAPEQMEGAPPRPAIDIHAYAALVLYALTGLDPRRLPTPERSDGWRALAGLLRSIGPGLLAAMREGLASDPARRPPLAALHEAVRRELAGTRRRRRRALDRERLAALLGEGTRSLASPAVVEPDLGIWLSAPMAAGSRAGGPEIRRSLNRGVAGPLYYCARYARHFPLPDEVRALCATSGRWLIEDRAAVDFAMPGLHFGETGVLLALYEARASGLLAFAHRDVRHLWSAVLDRSPDWPDLTHGAAGIAVGLGLIGDLAGADAASLPVALAAERRRFEAHLLASQKADGSWVLPPGVEGLSGETVTGFAHGVAGMAWALAVSGDRASLEAAIRAADWLLATAVAGPKGALAWPYSDLHPERWSWWCHGAPGISCLFTALFVRTGVPRWRDAALRCLAGVPDDFNPANLSQCHGAAGLGELLLDTARALDSPGLARKARSLGAVLQARHARGRRDVYWIVEDTEFVGADLMVGLSGVLHFLLRLVAADPALSFPAMPAIPCGHTAATAQAVCKPL